MFSINERSLYMHPYHRAVVKYLREAGAGNVRIKPGGKHPRCIYTWFHKEYFYVLPSSPGDNYHGQHKAISHLRRILRQAAYRTASALPALPAQ
jgi:hypothetical protein